MRRTPALVAASALLLALTACGGGGSAHPAKPSAASSSSPQASDKGAAQCNELIARSRVERLAGGAMGDPQLTDVGGLDACEWKGVKDPGAVVSIVRAPASQWADKLPPLIDQWQRTGVLAGVPKAKIARIRQLVAPGASMSDTQACQAFTTVLVELQQQPKGSTEVINWAPNPQHPQAVYLQACTHGNYTSVLYSSASLKPGKDLTERLKEAYDELTPAS